MNCHLLAPLLFLCCVAPAWAQSITATYVGLQTVPTGTVVDGAQIGGLSGITYDPYSDTFIAISDDSRTAGASRLWQLGLDYDSASFSAVYVNSTVSLKTSTGAVPPAADMEGIAANLGHSYYISQEGLASGTSPNTSPWIWRFNSLTGQKEAELALPIKFLPRNASGQAVPPGDTSQTSGVRPNLSLESLGIVPSHTTLFTANEAALHQDYSGTYNSTSKQAQNSEIRIVQFNGVPRAPTATIEKVYKADLGTLFFIVRRFNTVPEILPVDESGKMLVLERGLTQNDTNLGSYRIRLYEIDFNQATASNVAGVASLVGATYTRLSKTLVWESSTNMDNVEALCFGRNIDGFRTLVLASDNNFNAAQTTQFHVLLTNIAAVSRRTLNTDVAGGGTVSAEPAVSWYPDGSEVSLSATPDDNYSFGDWTGDTTSTTAVMDLTMNADKTVTARFLSPFQSWGADYFPAEQLWDSNWPNEDSESDGLSNLLEYALNLNPLQSSQAGLPTASLSNEQLILEYQKDTSKVDVSYQVQASSDLKNWSPHSDTLISTNGTIETRRASVPTENSLHFLRLKITTLF